MDLDTLKWNRIGKNVYERQATPELMPRNIIASCDHDRRRNADMLSAAPELLSFAIQYLYSEHGECAADDFAAPYTQEQLGEIARAAIRKAKGE